MTNNQDWVPLSIRSGDREEFSLSNTIPNATKPIITAGIRNLARYISPKFDLFFARLRIPVDFSRPLAGLFYSYMNSDEKSYMDGFDFILHSTSVIFEDSHPFRDLAMQEIRSIQDVLQYANVNWRISISSEGKRLCLERRVMPEVQKRYDVVAESVPELAGNHLRNSWKNAYMHGGSYKEAWEYARKAVECMLTPIVSPNNRRATISSLIRDMKVKPEKWVCAIPASNNKESVEKFISLLRMMPYEPGHHGQEPTEISEKEAQLQATLAITICQILHDGGLVLKSEEEQSE